MLRRNVVANQKITLCLLGPNDNLIELNAFQPSTFGLALADTQDFQLNWSARTHSIKRFDESTLKCQRKWTHTMSAWCVSEVETIEKQKWRRIYALSHSSTRRASSSVAVHVDINIVNTILTWFLIETVIISSVAHAQTLANDELYQQPWIRSIRTWITVHQFDCGWVQQCLIQLDGLAVGWLPSTISLAVGRWRKCMDCTLLEIEFKITFRRYPPAVPSFQGAR